MKFQVHIKPSQTLKYIDKVGTHTNETASAIPITIFDQLTKVISRTEEIAQIKIDKQYIRHKNEFIKSGLAPEVFPSLKSFWRKADASTLINDAKGEHRSVTGRNAHFWVGFTNICK